MSGGASGRLAVVAAAAFWLAGCSSESLRDQNYGSDLAQGYSFPDGGYHYQLDAPARATHDGGTGEADAGEGEDGAPDAAAADDTGGNDGGADASDAGASG